jgi:hypothetical protein
LRRALRFEEPTLRRPFGGRFLCGCGTVYSFLIISVLGLQKHQSSCQTLLLDFHNRQISFRL